MPKKQKLSFVWEGGRRREREKGGEEGRGGKGREGDGAGWGGEYGIDQDKKNFIQLLLKIG